MTHQNRVRAGIYIFPEVEILDFCGPYSVLNSVRTDPERRRETISPFEVCLISSTTQAVIAADGMRVLPDFSCANHPPLDLLVVPGGWGTREEMNNPDTINWISETSKKAKITASVCTGALLLGKAGLLENRRATTHWKSLDWMGQLFPNAMIVKNCRVTKDGAIFTSAGISAGIDLALILAVFYFGVEAGRNAAKHMEYPFPEELLGVLDQ
jgi:transcriptional regulator GlxA family with amidase domain